MKGLGVMFAVLRIIVGIVFLVSGFLKVTQPYEEFLFVVQSYYVLYPWAEEWVARLLPWLELFLGLFLVLGFWLRRTLLVSWVLAGAFVGVLGSALYRKLNIEGCGCLGSGLSLSPSLMLFFDMGLLFVLSLLLLFRARASEFGLDGYLNRLK